ncbi:MAG: metal ABC transporter permease [Candidatus Dojkabacteria bacterium]|uniref:High-affinity zinc uptake system membrane protein ZnuB n=2 Tax=Candidatus Dojkabacteria TaxID=74243 RepID=A0A136KK31_9BACT|nr:MAG: High-affinity zinc uptake system membrane protein ZnuB [candidate division WS6 bacterium OLB21]MBW7953740.1 metal ABC transporter permease [Candidatus Dojkabacteria bacterium]WKZ27460.1 MAG: metal ABC transporter permease [Candidatus Dojkabacteria bacterium]
MNELLEVIQLPFMQRAIIGGIIVSILCAIVGVFVTLRKESFLADAVSHASLAGVALAFLVAGQPTVFALITGIIMSTGIVFLKKRTTVSSDALIGIVYSFLFALGIIIISAVPGYKPELTTYLFGSLLSVGKDDITLSLIVFVIAISIFSIFYRQFLFLTFDSESAYLHGIRTSKLEYLLAILTSITIIISIKIVGIILVTAMLLIPATSARMLSKSFKTMIPFSIVQSVCSVIVGIAFAFFFNLPIGATIVVVSGLIIALIFLAKMLTTR